MADFAPTHPGEVLHEDFLKSPGFSQYALAKAIGVPQIRVSEIGNGKRAISLDSVSCLVGEVVVDAGAGEHDDADRKSFKQPIVALERCCLSVASISE